MSFGCQEKGHVAVDLVVARYRESVAWVRHVPASVRVFIYDKGHDLPEGCVPRARVQRVENVGREAHTYLTHILARLNDGDLAPVTFFCQGRPFDHAPDFHRILRAVSTGQETVASFRWLGFIIDTDDLRGRRLFVRWSKNLDGRELRVDLFHEELFGWKCPELIRFYPGGQFAVTEEKVRGRTRSFWEKALDLSVNFPDAAHCFERLWDKVFGVEGVSETIMGGRDCIYLKPIRRLMGGTGKRQV